MQKILLTGPESTGKTSLALRLAQMYRCPYVPEFARIFLSALDRPYREEDLVPLLLGQLDAEDTHSRQSPEAPYLFCDTGPEVLYVWSIAKYGRVADPIVEAVQTRKYGRRLLCYPDLPWEPDPLREAPDLAERIRLFHAYEAVFQEYQLDYEVVRGKRTGFQL